MECFAHGKLEHAGCPDCLSIHRSRFLSLVASIRAEQLTPAEMGELEKVAERFEGPAGFIRAAGFTVAGEVD
jgi:hypothetical protein